METYSATMANNKDIKYTFDARGQLISDEVTTLGAGVDGAVRKIAYSYDTLGNLQRVTSYNAANEIVNEVVRQFNGFGQLIREYQAVVGEVESGTPYVQYDFSEAAGGNHSRLAKITYPNGFELWYTYAAGLDSNVSRVTSFSDTPEWVVVEELVYQGEQIVGRNHYNNINSLITFDDFGRVAEVDWQYGVDSFSRYALTPYGVLTLVMEEDYTTISTSAYGWKHYHQGLEHNTTTGTYNNRNRVYLPALGQFASNDPLHFGAGDVNVRRYVGNGPVGTVDPSGLQPANKDVPPPPTPPPPDGVFVPPTVKSSLTVSVTRSC
jgi:RHS repeat-associated protein